MDNLRREGGCLCGNVRYEVTLTEDEFAVCHCSMCRKWSAGPMMCVHCTGDDVTWKNDTGLRWFRSSEWAERGFCATCGSSLFYRLANQPETMLVVSVESLDEPGDIKLTQHIFADQQPERYAFADNERRLSEAEVLREFGVMPDGA